MLSRTFLVLTFLISASALIAHAQTASQNSATATPGSGSLTDSSGNVWTTTTLNGIDDTRDSPTNSVVLLLS
jgi:hypothetical protein